MALTLLLLFASLPDQFCRVGLGETCHHRLAQWQQVEESELHGDTLYTVFKSGEVPAIFELTFISVTEADECYHSNEPLVIVTDGDEVHAYSTWQLEDHIVVNDRLGNKMITVTW